MSGQVLSRATSTQLLRQSCLRPALLAPIYERESYQKVLGFELPTKSKLVCHT
jgi:hypothetical protein